MRGTGSDRAQIGVACTCLLLLSPQRLVRSYQRRFAKLNQQLRNEVDEIKGCSVVLLNAVIAHARSAAPVVLDDDMFMHGELFAVATPVNRLRSNVASAHDAVACRCSCGPLQRTRVPSSQPPRLSPLVSAPILDSEIQVVA